jgi:hypothetical protein
MEQFVVICRADSIPQPCDLVPDGEHTGWVRCRRCGRRWCEGAREGAHTCFEGAPGPYELATRQVFDRQEAAEAWSRAIAPSRQPLVVAGRWHELRLP